MDEGLAWQVGVWDRMAQPYHADVVVIARNPA
jgi:hypothetical protein